MIVINSLFPVFALLILGAALKHFKLTNDTFLKTSDRLVYFIFFPALLFWKIGGAASAIKIDWPFIAAVTASVLLVYIISGLYIKLFHVSDYMAGSFSQSCYRFNTYIGMAIIIVALGDSGVHYFGILVGLIIPIINVLAVSTLIWFSGKQYTLKARSIITVKALISNPLIIACLAGILYARFNIPLPVFIDNTLRLISLTTLPLALISIGAALSFKSIGNYIKPALAASVIKLILLPTIGYMLLRLLAVEPLPFKVGMVFFALPTSTAIYILSSQLASDTKLASAAIVVSTVLSFGPLSIALLL